MERLETRELAYFVAVAEERHFGRAAARLGIAQPPLSRAIKQLEHRLDAALLERTSRGVLLTAAGEVLLADARQILAATVAAAARTKRAASEQSRLVLILKPGADGGLLAEVLAAYANAAESVPVDLRTCVFGEQADLLRAGEGDVALMHVGEQDLTGLDTEELSMERQVLVVARDHPLADRTEIRLAELRDEPTPLWGADSPIGRPGELLQLIALGRFMKLSPASVGKQLRRDLIAIPVVDAPPTPVLLAWPEQHRSKALAAFIQTALEVAAGPIAEVLTSASVSECFGHPVAMTRIEGRWSVRARRATRSVRH
jgi:DNA-binding transcriptional LysR family regulator